MYERYLAPNEEKELWKKYDRFCLNKIEEEKRKRYNVDVFKSDNLNSIEKSNDKNELQKNISIVYKKEKLFQKILKNIRNIFI